MQVILLDFVTIVINILCFLIHFIIFRFNDLYLQFHYIALFPLSPTLNKLLNSLPLQLVQMNPYAALCNKMLHDVISKLQRGECEGV